MPRPAFALLLALALPSAAAAQCHGTDLPASLTTRTLCAEPLWIALPEDHPLWDLENAQVTMHLSGRAQTKMFQRSADRFIENLERWHRGEAVQPQLDLDLGY